MVLDHGQHSLRGIEIYKGKAICYGLGAFFIRGKIKVLPASVFRAFPDATGKAPPPAPKERSVRPGGNPACWYDGVVVQIDLRDGNADTLRLYPLDTGNTYEEARRGVPHFADEANARRILTHLQEISAAFGTSIAIDGSVGVIGPLGRARGVDAWAAKEIGLHTEHHSGPCRTSDSWRQSAFEGAIMEIPVRTPEGEPLRCPLCGKEVALEVSITFRDATCPSCGFLLRSVRDLTQTWDLVRKAQGGDSGALDRLFQRYYERLRHSVRARLGRRLRSRKDSDDILQSVFAKLFANFDRFEMRHEGSFLHWLAEYAERQIHDIDRDDDEHTESKAAPIDKVVRRECEIAIEQCLEQMAERHRMVIVLRDYDGLEWNEVATKMGQSSESAVRELHRRARLELAKLLRQRGIGPEPT